MPLLLLLLSLRLHLLLLRSVIHARLSRHSLARPLVRLYLLLWCDRLAIGHPLGLRFYGQRQQLLQLSGNRTELSPALLRATQCSDQISCRFQIEHATVSAPADLVHVPTQRHCILDLSRYLLARECCDLLFPPLLNRLLLLCSCFLLCVVGLLAFSCECTVSSKGESS